MRQDRRTTASSGSKQEVCNLSKPGQQQVCTMQASPALLVGPMPAAPSDRDPAAAAIPVRPLLQICGAANYPQVVFVIAGALLLPGAADTKPVARAIWQQDVQVRTHLCLSTGC